MAPLKVTFEFNQGNLINPPGWTETWYLAGSGQQAAIAAANNLSVLLAGFRAKNVTLAGFRVSDLALPRLGTFVPVGLPGVSPTAGAPDLTNSALLVNAKSANGNRREAWFRGLQDNDILLDNNGNSQPSPFLRAAIIALFQALNGGGWSVWALLPATGANAFVSVASFAVDPASTATTLVTTRVAHNFVALTSFVYFTKVPKQFLPGVRGNFQVLSVPSPTTFTIGVPFILANPVNTTATRVRLFAKQTSVVNPITVPQTSTSSFIDRFGTHKTGKPLNSSRGKSRAVRLRP